MFGDRILKSMLRKKDKMSNIGLSIAKYLMKLSSPSFLVCL